MDVASANCTSALNYSRHDYHLPSLVASHLSFHGSSFILFTFYLHLFYKKEKLKIKSITKFIALLAFGDFIWSAITLIYLYTLRFGYCSLELCKSHDIIMESAAMFTVMITLSIAILSGLQFKFPGINSNDTVFYVLCVIDVAVPMAQQFLFFNTQKMLPQGFCPPDTKTFFYLWWVLLDVILIIIFLLFGIVIFNIWSTVNNELAKELTIKVSGYIIVNLLIWGSLSIYSAINFNSNLVSKNFGLLMSDFCYFASGFFNFIVYGLTNNQVRNSFGWTLLFPAFIFSPILFLTSFIALPIWVSYKTLKNGQKRRKKTRPDGESSLLEPLSSNEDGGYLVLSSDENRHHNVGNGYVTVNH